jgi:hypothetical protein
MESGKTFKSEYNEQFKRKTGNRLIKMNEKPCFLDQKMPLYGGFIWRTGVRTTGSPTV